MKRVLFVCSQNRLRSPTAEQVFLSHPGMECASAGTNNDAENRLSPELVEWADIIFVMERSHRTKIRSKYRRHLADTRIICMDIPDDYDFMDPELIALLKAKVGRFFPMAHSDALDPVVQSVHDNLTIIMGSTLLLRDLQDEDLPIFFQQELDPEARHMAAFVSKDAADMDAFMGHWNRIRNMEGVVIKTILFEGEVVGQIIRFEMFGEPHVSYWIGREYWGRGIASEALKLFLEQLSERPLHARAVKDNTASLRVLRKCGFMISGEDKGFSEARGEEVEEYILTLGAPECGEAG